MKARVVAVTKDRQQKLKQKLIFGVSQIGHDKRAFLFELIQRKMEFQAQK